MILNNQLLSFLKLQSDFRTMNFGREIVVFLIEAQSSWLKPLIFPLCLLTAEQMSRGIFNWNIILIEVGLGTRAELSCVEEGEGRDGVKVKVSLRVGPEQAVSSDGSFRSRLWQLWGVCTLSPSGAEPTARWAHRHHLRTGPLCLLRLLSRP